MIRRLTAVVASGAVALVGFGAVGAAPASADSVPLYKLPYSDGLFIAVVDGEDLDVQDISYEQWEELGFPAYQLLSTQYFKSSFSPEVYAVTDFPGTAYDRFPDALSYAEWASVGFPTPQNGDRVVVQYVQYSTSAELFAVGQSSSPVKLSYEQWASVGFPAPEPTGFGFHKLSWDDHIAFRSDDGQTSDVLTLEDWALFGYPSPQVSPRLPGDRFYFASGDTDVITYQGPSFAGPLTLAQWIAAGQPAPEAYEPATAVAILTAGGTPSDLLPEVSGTGEPAADITLTVGTGEDAEVVGTATVDEDGEWSTVAVLTAHYGEQVTVTATQAFAGKDDEIDSVDFDLDLGAVIGSPVEGAGPLSREELQVSGTGRPGDEVRLSVGASAEDVDALLLGFATVDVDGTWSTTVDVGDVAAIESVLVAGFSDEDGPSGSDSVAIELDVVAAAAVDLGTVDGGTVPRSLIPVVSGTGEAGADVVLTVTTTGGVVAGVGSVQVDEDGTWTTPVDLEGYYGQTVTLAAAQAIPASGTTQDSISVDLDLGLTITSPAEGAAVASRSFEMTGTGVPGSTVTLTWGNHPDDEQPDLIGSPVVATDGTWTADVVVADDAPVTSWLSATSAAEPRAQVTVQLPAVAQTFTITSPANGATGVARGMVTATGTGVPGSAIHIDVEKADDPGIAMHLTFDSVPASGIWELTYDTSILGFDDQRLIDDNTGVSVVYTLVPVV